MSSIGTGPAAGPRGCLSTALPFCLSCSQMVCNQMVRVGLIGWLAFAAACSDPASDATTETVPNSGTQNALTQTGDRDYFSERAAALGVDFVHFNGMTGEFYMAEVTGAGLALFDYDNDGDLDLYLLQGQILGPGKSVDDALFPPPGPAPLSDRLFRNDPAVTDDGAPSFRFTDVTDQSGIRAHGYGMAVATGDYDNDGWVDLYVTNLESNQLWHNDGDGTFTDATAASGTDDDRWSVPATFTDYDRDGWLDLFVGNYISAHYENRPICRDFTGAQDYCGPGSFEPEADRLFHNRGDGSFEDVSQSAGLVDGFGGALGAVAADFDGDRWPDLYVTNDSLPNNLWTNHRDGTFSDEALLAGCSVNAKGKAEASMGVDAADFDGDGDLDLFMTHLTGETNTLFVNDGEGVFEDYTIDALLGPSSRPYTSFGTAWFDYDNDGWLDLLIVNGAVKKIEALARQQDPFPLHQPNQLYRNLGHGQFEEATSRAGEAFELSEVSRGAAFGDLDNDGDTDVVILNNAGPARVLINNVGNRNHWLGLRLVGRRPPRDMLGAVVGLERDGRPTLWRRVHTDGSFGAARDPRLLFGLGDDDAGGRLTVLWPDGSTETWSDLPIDRYTTLTHGGGTPVADS